MRARATEIKAIIEELENTHLSAEKCAAAVFNTVVDLLRQRDGLVLVWRPDDELAIAYGPFWDKVSLKKFIKTFGYGKVTSAVLRGPISSTERTEKALRPPTSQYCEKCKHPKDAHKHEGKHYGKCVVKGCDCEE